METFKGDQVEVNLKHHGGCDVEMSISVSPEGCSAAYAKAVKEVRKRVSIPGFRKGKAPEALIQKQYKSAIDQQWEETLVNTALHEGLRLTKLYPWQSGSVPPPKIENRSMEGALMTFRYESEPKVPQIDFSSLEVKKIKPDPITDEKVAERMAQTRRDMGKPEPVEGHAAEMGDFVRIDIESLEKETPEKLMDNHLIEMKFGEVGAWLIDSLVGKKAGEIYSVASAPDKEASEEFKKEFNPVEYRITVRSVEQLKLPTDEELLQKVNHPSIEAWEKAVRQQQEQQEAQKAKGQQVKELWEALMNAYPYELPKTLVEEDKRLEIRRQVDSARRQGASDKQIRKEEKEIEALAEAHVKQRFYAFFLSRKLLRELDKLPTDQELTNRALQLLQWEAISSGNFAALKNPPRPGSDEMKAYRNQAFLILTQEKAEDHILNHVKLTS